MSLRDKLYQEIHLKKRELEEVRKNGGKVNVEWDLPCVGAGCEYSGLEMCGFSRRSKHLTRPDIHYPFDPLLHNALMQQAPNVPQLPYVLFSKKRLPAVDANGEVKYKRVVEKFVGTCAEDNAANSLLYGLNPAQKPSTLKDITFIHPVRPRTLKRVKMCDVCKNIFTEP